MWTTWKGEVREVAEGSFDFKIRGMGAAETLTQSAPMARKVRTGLENMMMECRKREQITMAPGLKLERLEKGAGESCTAAEETKERTLNFLYISVNHWVQVRVVEFQLTTGT